MGNKSKSIRRDRILLRNDSGKQITFRLEPWGEEFPMPIQAEFEVIAEGADNGVMEITVSEGAMTVYGWVGSVLTVYHQGKELGGGGEPVPSLPGH